MEIYSTYSKQINLETETYYFNMNITVSHTILFLHISINCITSQKHIPPPHMYTYINNNKYMYVYICIYILSNKSSLILFFPIIPQINLLFTLCCNFFKTYVKFGYFHYLYLLLVPVIFIFYLLLKRAS